MEEPIRILRTARRTVALEITPGMQIIVRAPLRMSDAEIRAFLAQKRPWMEKHLERMREEAAEAKNTVVFTAEELAAYKKRTLAWILPKVEACAQMLGVTYGRVTVRCQKTRWGSCSVKGNLSFHCLLALCPEAVAEYVVVHELCHRRHMNHSRAFWEMVERYCPEYRVRKNWLRENGQKLLARLGVRE